jgi:hypothetical protein
MMIKLFCVALTAVVFLSADAWGSVQAATNASTGLKNSRACVFPKSRKRAPGWVCGKRVEGLALTAVGSATRSRAGIAFMEQMAVADARTHLVQQVRASVQNRLVDGARTDKDAAARNGALLTKITDESLQGTRVEKRANGPHGSLYVLVGLDEASAKRLVETITAEYQSQRRH